MTEQFDIVVVGAGMVGAALATGLGQSGFSVALVDRETAPVFDPIQDPDIRVSAISAGSERYLRRLGAWGHIDGMRTTPYTRLAVWDDSINPLSSLLPRRLNRTTFSATELGVSHLGHIVENRVTQKALWDSAASQASVSLMQDDAVASIQQDSRQAAVTLASGQVLTCQLVVGADGANSVVRSLAGIGTSRDQYGQHALVASVRVAGAPGDITWQAFHPSGPRAFLPLHAASGVKSQSESWASLVWYDAPDVLARLKTLPDRDFLSEVQTAFPEELPALTHVAARASFPIARQHAHHYSHNRVVLAGDAAHTINPLAGQGVNLGFQDAECLQSLLHEAKRAGDDLATGRLLDRYEQRRRPANTRMMLAMDAFYYLFSNRIPPVHLIRNLGLGLAQRVPFARNQVARYAMGLDDGSSGPLQAWLKALPKPPFMTRHL
ncbi:FAD-dependent monooxygenase [Marinobacter caseinilyticus]|uniref:FAD-dependent monooxygenase n=1 Tax=Marinobacter caseinilyticus TaxID=2692195 RepID=UPI00140CE8C2|nr:FAD-dependent monooxygenase [Marinobacter caseinilyticus]